MPGFAPLRTAEAGSGAETTGQVAAPTGSVAGPSGTPTGTGFDSGSSVALARGASPGQHGHAAPMGHGAPPPGDRNRPHVDARSPKTRKALPRLRLALGGIPIAVAMSVAEQREPHVRIVEGPLTGARFRLATFSVVGRHPTCDVVLFGRSVSREHAALRCRDAVVELNDLASVNGVYLNGERLTRRRRVRMGDRIRIADHVLLFVLEHPDRTDPTARQTAHLPRVGLSEVVESEDATQRIELDPPAHTQAS